MRSYRTPRIGIDASIPYFYWNSIGESGDWFALKSTGMKNTAGQEQKCGEVGDEKVVMRRRDAGIASILFSVSHARYQVARPFRRLVGGFGHSSI